jgi:hypothetical protein
MTAALLEASTISPSVLPRARSLTDALLATAEQQVDTSATVASELRDRLTAALARRRPPAGDRVIVSGYSLRLLLEGQQSAQDSFRWSPRTARRTLGLAAVRACVAGECRTPAEAVRSVVAGAVGQAERDGATPRSLGAWLAGLPAGGRAAAQADAVTWATALFGALEWDRLPAASEVGGPDRWWDAGGGVALRGRADLRTMAGDRPSLFCVGNGRPMPSSRAELLLAALVDVVRNPRAPAPARVVGWWPASGRALSVPVSEAALSKTAALVVEAAGRWSDLPA